MYCTMNPDLLKENITFLGGDYCHCFLFVTRLHPKIYMFHPPTKHWEMFLF